MGNSGIELECDGDAAADSYDWAGDLMQAILYNQSAMLSHESNGTTVTNSVLESFGSLY
jgi:hypothetical protein